MNVLFNIHGYPNVHNAGAELMAHSIARFLIKRGCRVDVLTGPNMAPGEGTVLDGVNVWCKYSKEREQELFKAADVVITHLDRTVQTIQRCQASQKPLVHLIHNPRVIDKWKIDSGNCQLAVYNSFWLMKAMAKHKLPAMVLYPPVFREDYEVTPNPRGAATLINLNENKGGAVLWQLARDLPDRPFIGVKGAYHDQILGTSSNVTLLDHASDMRSIYAQTGVLLVPSKSETWGRVAHEAAWSGIPVIAHPTDGLREMLGSAGIFLDRLDGGGWAKMLEKLWDHPEFWATMSTQVRRRAQQVWAENLIQLEAFWQALHAVVSRSSQRVHAVASEPHFLDHAAAVYHAIPPAHRGYVFVAPHLQARAARLGMPSVGIVEGTRAAGDQVVWGQLLGSPGASLTLVTSRKDQDWADPLTVPVVRIEHGSGQSYEPPTSSYAGGEAHGRLVAFLVPGEAPAARHRASHPGVPVYVVGCPKLDPWARIGFRDREPDEGDKPVLVFSWHWDCHVYPETRATLPEWKQAILDLQATGDFIILGHAHPRYPAAFTWYEKVGIPIVRDFVEVLDRADLYICDNSSTLFEAAALGLRTLVLNGPLYRRHHSHGLRFWDAVPGPQCTDPKQLESAVRAVLDAEELPEADAAARVAYAVVDGAMFWVREAIGELLRAAVPDRQGHILAQVLINHHHAGSIVKRGALIWLEKKAFEEKLERRLVTGRIAPSGELQWGAPNVTWEAVTEQYRWSDAARACMITFGPRADRLQDEEGGQEHGEGAGYPPVPQWRVHAAPGSGVADDENRGREAEEEAAGGGDRHVPSHAREHAQAPRVPRGRRRPVASRP